MGSSPLMSLGIRAMAANYAALQTTGHNIANASVKGYSRQQVELATSQGQFTGAGFFGRGVDVVSVTRSHSEFLTREADAAGSLSAMDGARLQQLKRLENIFQPGEAGLGQAASELFAAMVDLTSNPSDLATRQVVLARASDMAARFADAGSALDDTQSSVTAELKTSVASINSLAKSVASANQRLAALRGLGQPANDVLDERERLVAQISEQVKVTRMEADDGTLALFIGGGQRLVLGAEAAELRVVQDRADPARSAVAIVDGNNLRPLADNALGGGGVAGLLRFQNQDLAAGRNLVGRLALAVGGAVNSQQLRGVSLQSPLGQVAGSALFAMGPSQGLANASNQRDAGGMLIGSVALTITDPAALQASDYQLRESTVTPGAWDLTRLSDGRVTTVNSGDTIDGMRIDIVNPQSGDRFLLQPVTRGANGMGTLLADPRDLAAASPLLATTAAANSGTAAVASLRVSAAPLPVADGSARITFTSDTGNYNWELYDSSSTLLSSGSGTWTAGQAVPAPPQDINGFSLQLSGVPRTGDIVDVQPTPASAISSNNGNAAELLSLRDALLAGGYNYSDSWSQALAEVGTRTQSAQSGSEISAAVAQQAERSRSEVAGVNLDEEAARLIQYQQTYQAAAKVLQIAQTLFDTLLDTAGR